MMNRAEMCAALRRRVLDCRDAGTGVWTGKLSTSALATALAVAALKASGGADDARAAARGAGWLTDHVNGDGGWGDTPESASNLSTTLIVAAALRKADGDGGSVVAEHSAVCLANAARWVEERVGGPVTPDAVARALVAVYGADRTFAVPILAFLAVCGDAPSRLPWSAVPSLPFLLALLPRRAFGVLRLNVVSYALPALIAVGLCRHVCAARSRGRWAWGQAFARPLLSRLSRLQPTHGGFLDAVPLTAFVCLALRAAGYGGHPVVAKGLDFVRRSARPDGGWPIDSNLRTWVTSLAARAVWRSDAERRGGAWKLDAGGVEDAERVAAWLVGTQTKARHPYTGAAPGGWAWTDLPGGVPDADDTSAALIALKRLKAFGCRTDVSAAMRAGLRWLMSMQNADGGMPTFCKGWGRLPFDQSCADISAHALAAFSLWSDVLPNVPRAMAGLIRFLKREQADDGSWCALWFGHQEAPGGRNPVIGTARVVAALRATLRAGVLNDGASTVDAMLRRGESWLAARQHPDDGWGMGTEATVEETALAVAALMGGGEGVAAARGVDWLLARGETGLCRPAPIGLYFALLWYHEALYPLIWSLEALGSCEKQEGNG